MAHRTAYHALRSVARVQPGEWVVVLGAAGGVGLAAVELAPALGARMLAVASSAEKLAVCLDRGAEAAVDYATEDLKVRIKEITGGGAARGGRPGGGSCRRAGPPGSALGRSLRHRRVRLGRDPEHPAQPGAVEGGDRSPASPWRGSPATRPRTVGGTWWNSGELARAGRAAPYISATYPLDQVGRALSDLADRRAVGKVLVDPTR